MNSWHLDRDLLQRYAAGNADLPLAGSVEAHLMACATCRRLVDGAVSAERLARIWQTIEAGIDAPLPTTLQRIRARLGLTTVVLGLVSALTNLLRPSWRLLGAMTGVMLVVVAAWVASSHVTTVSRPGSGGSAIAGPRSSANQAHQAWTSGPPLINAADVPAMARAMAYRSSPSGDSTSVGLNPCVAAAIVQGTQRLAVKTVLFQDDSMGKVRAELVVLQSQAGRNRVDAYVVAQGCTTEKGQLLEMQMGIPRTLDDIPGRTI